LMFRKGPIKTYGLLEIRLGTAFDLIEEWADSKS
jgi:hypothetical protein